MASEPNPSKERDRGRNLEPNLRKRVLRLARARVRRPRPNLPSLERNRVQAWTTKRKLLVRQAYTPIEIEKPCRTLSTLYAIDNEPKNITFTCLKGQSLNSGDKPDEPSSRSDTSLSDLLRELRKRHRVGLARESYTCSLPGYTIFEQATGGCLGTISAGITGFRHLGGTEDTDTVLGATKAKMFTDVTNARCFGSARNWKAWVHLLTEQVHY